MPQAIQDRQSGMADLIRTLAASRRTRDALMKAVKRSAERRKRRPTKRKRKKSKKKPASKKKRVETSSKKRGQTFKGKHKTRKDFMGDGCKMIVESDSSWWTGTQSAIEKEAFDNTDLDSYCYDTNGTTPTIIANATFASGSASKSGEDLLWKDNTNMMYSVLKLGYRYPGSSEPPLPNSGSEGSMEQGMALTRYQSMVLQANEVFNARSVWSKWRSPYTLITIKFNGKVPVGWFSIIHGRFRYQRMKASGVASNPNLVKWDNQSSIDEVVTTEKVYLSAHEVFRQKYGAFQVGDLAEGEVGPSYGYVTPVGTPQQFGYVEHHADGSTSNKSVTINNGTHCLCRESITRDRAWKKISSSVKGGQLVIKIKHPTGWQDTSNPVVQEPLPVVVFAFDSPTIFPKYVEETTLGVRPTALQSEGPCDELVPSEFHSDLGIEDGDHCAVDSEGNLIINGSTCDCDPLAQKFSSSAHDKDPNKDYTETIVDERTIQLKEMATVNCINCFQFSGRLPMRRPVAAVATCPDQMGYDPYHVLTLPDYQK